MTSLTIVFGIKGLRSCGHKVLKQTVRKTIDWTAKHVSMHRDHCYVTCSCFYWIRLDKWSSWAWCAANTAFETLLPPIRAQVCFCVV